MVCLKHCIVSDRAKSLWVGFGRGCSNYCKLSSWCPPLITQTEVVNRCLEGYLRCMVGEQPTEWSKWYNTNYQSSINTTPSEVLYGQPPPIHVPYLGGENRVKAVDRSLRAREEAVKVLKFHLKESSRWVIGSYSNFNHTGKWPSDKASRTSSLQSIMGHLRWLRR